ncbi:MAG: phosphoglycerate kinase, partial [Campylobacterota bacterium]|nr:phosphoglycerate kinase [Campylobacterota bacterium]
MLSNIEFMQSVKSLKNIDIEDKRVLIRVDFNVPMDKQHNITDDNRIKEALHTINYCIDHNAKQIVLVTHLGKPKGYDENLSLKHIIKRVERLIDKNITLIDNFIKDNSAIKSSKDGDIFLLENIRFFEGETSND